MKTHSLILLFTFLFLLFAYCNNDTTSDSSKSKQSINYVANKKELAWLKNNCIKIKTVQSESGFEDLQPLKKMIGSSRIVALGENTHGTSEVFKMKHRLIEFLATEMGFTILSVEVGMPEAYILNDYVINGNGNPKEIIKNWGFYLNTQEFLDMIDWMRNFNTNGKGIIQFTGFDTNLMAGSLDILNKYAELNSMALKSMLDSISTSLDKLQSEGPHFLEDKRTLDYIKLKCDNVFSYLSKNKRSITKSVNESEYNWLVQNANILIQSAEASIRHTEIAFRDKCMAENVAWILNDKPKEKIILWAHIGHTRKELPWMGGYLSEKYGSNYYSIGTVSNSGTYSAGTSSLPYTLIESKTGSFEYSFHKLGIPLFYLDFNQVKDNEPNCIWLRKTLNYRGIGAYATDKQFYPTKISDWFNAITYFDSTHSSDCFDYKR